MTSKKTTPNADMPPPAPVSVTKFKFLPEALQKGLYGKYMHIFELLQGRTRLTLKLAQEGDALEEGDIFLFNHFTRFETMVPPYVIFKETGKLTRSVAYQGLFELNGRFTKGLYETGGTPSGLPRLLPFLAEEILRGRKVVIFPEGGLVKDKLVVDGKGTYAMWSGSAERVRQQHRGAAVLALMLDLAKRHILDLFDSGNTDGVSHWCDLLQVSRAELLLAAGKPTMIVPGNITFYPIRTNANWITWLAQKALGHVSMRALDEMTIESNLLLYKTDMDLRFGYPMRALPVRGWRGDKLLERELAKVKTMDDVFDLAHKQASRDERHVKDFLEYEIERVRSDYAERIYEGTTINLNHMMSTLITILAENNEMEIEAERFERVLYTAIKALQRDPKVHLHCSLTRVENYAGVRDGTAHRFDGFMKVCVRSKLIRKVGNYYRISFRMKDALEIYEVRLENPVRVHTNEAAPIEQVRKTLEKALKDSVKDETLKIAHERFDDMLRDYVGQRIRWGKRAPETLINPRHEPWGRPFLLTHTKKAKVGVLLVHGFAAGPHDLKAFGEQLHADGHAVLGVRLPGHATSYMDMELRSRADWMKEVRNGLDILSAFAETVVIVGFSTGAALGLALASEGDPRIAGVASVSAPVFVTDKNMQLLPYIMPLRKIFSHIPGMEYALRLYPYGVNNPEQCYRMVPVRGLNELRLTIAEMLAKLGKVKVPVLIMQGLSDKTVQAKSASTLLEKIGSADKELKWVASGPHALIPQNFGDTWDTLRAFVKRFEHKKSKV